MTHGHNDWSHPYDGGKIEPASDWYRRHAEQIARQYARLLRPLEESLAEQPPVPAVYVRAFADAPDDYLDPRGH